MSESDQELMRALGKAREQHQELAPLLDFYLDLFQVQLTAKENLPDPEVRDELAIRWRLDGGIPQLTFDQLGVQSEPFAQLVADVREVLLTHNPSWDPDPPPEDWTPGQLVTLAREVFETWDTLTAPRQGTAPSELAEQAGVWTMAVGLSLAAYLQRAAKVILPHLELDRWVSGHCPICGGRPNFSLLEPESGARKLMCSRCSSQWGFSRTVCPFCDTDVRPGYYPSDDGLYRLYVCSSCRRYLKTIDLRHARREVFPTIERLVTVGMDLAAQQEGYSS